MSNELFEQGLAIRKAVLGKDYVEKSLATADDFSRTVLTLLQLRVAFLDLLRPGGFLSLGKADCIGLLGSAWILNARKAGVSGTAGAQA